MIYWEKRIMTYFTHIKRAVHWKTSFLSNAKREEGDKVKVLGSQVEFKWLVPEIKVDFTTRLMAMVVAFNFFASKNDKNSFTSIEESKEKQSRSGWIMCALAFTLNQGHGIILHKLLLWLYLMFLLKFHKTPLIQFSCVRVHCANS